MDPTTTVTTKEVEKSGVSATAVRTTILQRRRLKREDYYRTKHDPIFSKWQLLIGPTDWENYTLGKNGSERYRIHNLPPACSCPGIYELGVATTTTNGGREIRKLDPYHIVVVYVGQADNVRNRLQHYGRAGSHLDHGNSVTIPDTSDTSRQNGPGLFKEIFARGFSIVFRWAAMESKRHAENAEALLLGVFDYAWNRRTNGSCRRDDVLLKLKSMVLPNNLFDIVVRELHFFKIQVFNRKRVGMQVESGETHKDLAISDSIDSNQTIKNDSRVCGVTKSNGSICENKPVSERKRCADHKGKRINKSTLLSTAKESSFALEKVSRDYVGLNSRPLSIVCGIILEDGSICMKLPYKGRKRCESHKGRRIIKPKSPNLAE